MWIKVTSLKRKRKVDDCSAQLEKQRTSLFCRDRQHFNSFKKLHENTH